jgi:hypothetical protein
MGVREINDGRDSLLTQRLENLRKVERREGEAGGQQKFQQVFEFADREESEEKKEETSKPEPTQATLLPAPPLRVITPEEIEKVQKRNELKPGQLIDLEA